VTAAIAAIIADDVVGYSRLMERRGGHGAKTTATDVADRIPFGRRRRAVRGRAKKLMAERNDGVRAESR